MWLGKLTSAQSVRRLRDCLSSMSDEGEAMSVHPRTSPPLRPAQLPSPVLGRWEWQFQASCRGHSIDVFFPERTRGAELARLEAIAKRICADCPVMKRCREHALEVPEVWGVWGALTSRERAHMYLSRNAIHAEGPGFDQQGDAEPDC
jgi:WhiB family transcriptional regulator, redox-sensing transcriptional regulator